MHDDETTGASRRIGVRTRRILSGNGEVDIHRSVSCPREDREVSLHTCLARDCCTGFEDGELGSYVECEHAADETSQLVHLPVRAQQTSGLARRSRADGTSVSAIMTADVLCVRADVSVDDLVPLLLERGISGVPVVDATGAPIGVVSKTDLVRERYENADLLELRRGGNGDGELERGYGESSVGRTLVSDVMVGMTFALPEDATVSQASALMAYEGVHRVPVVNADGKVVGIVSALDILRWLAHEDGYLIGRHAPD